MKQCKDCKWWKFYAYAWFYVYPPKWFFRECALWLHDRKPICLTPEKEHYERKRWKLWAPKVLLITLALLLGGCMSYRGEKTSYRPDGSVETRIKASMTHCLVDSSRTDFKVEVEGLGKASVGSSVIDAESLAEIIKALPEGIRKELLMLLGVQP